MHVTGLSSTVYAWKCCRSVVCVVATVVSRHLLTIARTSASRHMLLLHSSIFGSCLTFIPMTTWFVFKCRVVVVPEFLVVSGSDKCLGRNLGFRLTLVSDLVLVVRINSDETPRRHYSHTIQYHSTESNKNLPQLNWGAWQFVSIYRQYYR